MKAVCITAVAPPGELAGKFEIRDVPAPTPGPDQVRVRVLYAAVNIDDLRIAEGRFPVPGKSIRPSEAKPHVPGHDFAGIVDAVGERVTRLKVGDRVYGQASGAWAELCVADVRSAGVLPEGWSPQRAVSYVMGALVARAAIDKVPQVEGKTGLVIGASGSIGNVALQFLVHHGAKIWAVCSGRNAEAVKALGADAVVDYTKAPFDEQVLEGETRFAFVIDFVGGRENERASYRVLKPHGRFVTAVGPVDFSDDIDVGARAMAKVVGYLAARTLTPAFLRPKYSFAMMPTKPDLSAPPLGEDVEPLIDSEHDFDSDGVAQSIRRVQSHRAAGKVLIKIAAEQRSQQ